MRSRLTGGTRGKQLRFLRLCSFSVTPTIVILLYIFGRPAYLALNAQLKSPAVTPAAVVQTKQADAVPVVGGVPVLSEPVKDKAESHHLALGDPKNYKLTPEFVKRHAKNNVIMVTWANDHYYDFVMNWVTHLKKLNMTNYVVGAMDDNLLVRLVEQNIPAFSMQSGLTTGDFGWGTATFHKMGREKINLIRLFVNMGFDIMVSDVDTVWMRDPLEYVERYPEADILTSSDHLSTTVPDDGLEHYNLATSPANIGVMFVRKVGLELVNEWNDILEKDDKVWDQNAFNDIFRKGAGEELPNRLFKAYHGKLKMGILPVSLFCSGHTFFVQRLHEKVVPKQELAYVVHATFQFAGTEGKRHRMREAMIWESDGPEYYDPPGGLLVFKPDVPDDLLAGYDSKEGHFALVNHQIKQVRDALALASALNRTFVFPRLICGWDRWWAPHRGTIPHSSLPNPYLCPADHVFDLEVWGRKRSFDEFGPETKYREYSILDNPRMPQSAKDSKVTVDVCAQRPGPSCGGSSALVKLEKPLTDSEAVRLFAPLKDVKVLEFSSMLGAFAGFEKPEDQQRFHRRVKEYGGIWCCIAAHPGHIWYDLLWDQPHTDRHGRVFNSTWSIMLGP